MARRKVCQLLSNLYSQHQFLLDSNSLNDKEQDFFRSISIDMDDVAATMAIYELCLYLSRYYGKLFQKPEQNPDIQLHIGFSQV